MNRPVVGLQQEVGVLHPLGDALERHGLSQVVVAQEGGEFVVGDVGIDGHGAGMREGRWRSRVSLYNELRTLEAAP
jgi:hypothetical protein